MTRLNRNLVNELRGSEEGGAGVQAQPRRNVTMCQLKMKLNCCQGLGYQVSTNGAYTKAEVCTCVKSCQSCHGQARYARQNKSVPCQVPHPRVVANLLNAAALPSRYGSSSLSGFKNFSGNGQMAVERICGWAKAFKKGDKGLLIEGPVGVGKTYLLAALTKVFATRGVSVKFVDFFQLLAELKASYSQNKADDSLLKPLINVDVLVIDELGKGRNSDWELSILDQLVMGRYNQNKTILASTNYSTKEQKNTPVYRGSDHLDNQANPGRGFREQDFDQSLENRVGSRIFSRLLETCHFVNLTGDDFRRRFVQNATGIQR